MSSRSFCCHVSDQIVDTLGAQGIAECLLRYLPLKFTYSAPGPVSQKFRKRFGPEKPLVKLRLAYSVTLVFLYVVTGIKIKLTAKFRASRRLSFEDTKRIMSPEMRPKSFGTFEKQAPGP